MNMIIHLGNDTDTLESGMGNQSADLKLSRRQNIHRQLVSYAELVHWLKTMDPPAFEGKEDEIMYRLFFWGKSGVQKRFVGLCLIRLYCLQPCSRLTEAQW